MVILGLLVSVILLEHHYFWVSKQYFLNWKKFKRMPNKSHLFEFWKTSLYWHTWILAYLAYAKKRFRSRVFPQFMISFVKSGWWIDQGQLACQEHTRKWKRDCQCHLVTAVGADLPSLVWIYSPPCAATMLDMGRIRSRAQERKTGFLLLHINFIFFKN